MANTLVKTFNVGNGHIYVFHAPTSGTSENLQLPAGKSIAIPLWVGYIAGGTPTAAVFQYTRSTGVMAVTTLTASNDILFAILTD